MKLLEQRAISAPKPNETVFRISFWGPLLTCLLFVLGFLFGLALLFYSYSASSVWGMVLAGFYTLVMWGLCQMVLRALRATFAAANWLARLGPEGLLIKYRSYLHGDLPEEDPVVLQLGWSEIASAQLQKELYTTTDSDGKHQVTRWFLALKLDGRFVDVAAIRAALEFESRRKPAGARIDELKHELFEARKSRAGAAEIAGIKQEIAREKQQYPDYRSRARFRDRPLVFVEPDLLKLEWTHLRPGRKPLRELLEQHARLDGDSRQQIDIEQPLSKEEFEQLLTTLLGRDATLEALKLVRLQLGLGTTEARAYLERLRNPQG